MNWRDDIHLYLPKYLSEESTKELIKNIGEFPNNISNSLYTNYLYDTHTVFQGDGLKSLKIINLPDMKIGEAPSIILSNTCDIEPSNKRPFPSQVCYAPIFRLEKYIDSLKQSDFFTNHESLNQHIERLKQQHITQILYLPIGGGLEYEGIVFLDRINNCQNRSISRDNMKQNRLFSLSNYGHYLLLTKLSIHFSRLQEKVDRNLGIAL
ncbi:MAG: hypothetical protein LBB84_05030 [Tannerellaceae bacterium]|jgi:hypothetical protein|nr:hypothetical protein [Tannerellaceae bacterium]